MSKRFQKVCALTIVFAFLLTILPLPILATEAEAATITVTTTEAKSITETNAVVYGKVSYSGTRPSSVGIYFGTSSSSMQKVASDKISHNKNPFDMWYDLNAEANITLKAGTTYYYQCYAIQDGKETKGAVVSFTTKGTQSSITVTTTEAKNITATNAVVYGKVSYSGTRPSSVGIYFGTSSSSMKKVASDTISHNKNPFDMWYDLNDEANITLESGTTYYYQCYAIQDGKEAKGAVVSFRTGGTVSSEAASTVITSCSHEYNDKGYCKKCNKEYPLDLQPVYIAMKCTKDNAAVHDRPYGAATIISRYNTNDQMKIVYQTKNCFGNTWYQTAQGGWIASDYATEVSSEKTTVSAGTTDVMTTYWKALDILKARNGSSYTSFPGNACTYLTAYQLEALGIIGTKEFSGGTNNAHIKWAGGSWYKYLSAKNGTKTKTGYTITTYQGANALKSLVAKYDGQPVYNIVVDMPGHVMFIHAIVNGTVYYTDNYKKDIWSKKEKKYLKQQQTNTLPLDTFISYYQSWNGEMKGVIHFTKEQTLPLVYV